MKKGLFDATRQRFYFIISLFWKQNLIFIFCMNKIKIQEKYFLLRSFAVIHEYSWTHATLIINFYVTHIWNLIVFKCHNDRHNFNSLIHLYCSKIKVVVLTNIWWSKPIWAVVYAMHADLIKWRDLCLYKNFNQ